MSRTEQKPQSGKPIRNSVILGITGGVGAGKSTILSYLKDAYEAAVIEADAVGHQVQQTGEPCWEEIVKTFGPGILNPDGSIDRLRLGAIVYADRGKMNRLNAIVHPAVKERILDIIDSLNISVSTTDTDAACWQAGGTAHASAALPDSQPGRLIVIEAALLLEDHYDEICDEVWYVYADDQTRMQRLMDARGYSKEKVQQIMSNQLTEEEFRRRSDAVVDNSSSDVRVTYAEIDRMLRRMTGEDASRGFEKG